MRNTRNFWIEAKVDGRKSTIAPAPGNDWGIQVERVDAGPRGCHNGAHGQGARQRGRDADAPCVHANVRHAQGTNGTLTRLTSPERDETPGTRPESREYHH